MFYAFLPHERRAFNADQQPWQIPNARLLNRGSLRRVQAFYPPSVANIYRSILRPMSWLAVVGGAPRKVGGGQRLPADDATDIKLKVLDP